MNLLSVVYLIKVYEGYFKFEGIAYGKYYLILSSVGFESITREIELTEGAFKFAEPFVMQQKGIIWMKWLLRQKTWLQEML